MNLTRTCVESDEMVLLEDFVSGINCNAGAWMMSFTLLIEHVEFYYMYVHLGV